MPIWEQLVDSRTVELTANDNTPYTWFWLDLRNGPLVLEAPPKVLGLVNDIWYHWNGDIGFTGPDKGAGGKFLLLPPGYKDEVPDGYHVVRAPRSDSGSPGAASWSNGSPSRASTRSRRSPRSTRSARPAARRRSELRQHVRQAVQHGRPGDYPFWEMLNEAVQNEPTDAIDATTLGFWASLGIEKGKPFAPDERMKKILTEAAAAGDATGRALFYRNREQGGVLLRKPPLEAAVHRRLQVRVAAGRANLDAAAMFFFAATGVTPAMDTQIVGEGSTYPWTASTRQQSARRRQDLQAAPAAEHPGQELLVGHRL